MAETFKEALVALVDAWKKETDLAIILHDLDEVLCDLDEEYHKETEDEDEEEEEDEGEDEDEDSPKVDGKEE